MDIQTLEGLTKVLQASISPVALISGVGLLILSQTNRFGRVADRLRELRRHQRQSPAPVPMIDAEVAIFHRRARILRAAIGLAVASVLFVSVLVLFLFGMAVLDMPMASVALLLFALSLICLTGSLALFLLDMHLALQAIEAELRG